MKNSLTGLLRLQEVDNEIDALQKGKEDAPHTFETLVKEKDELEGHRQGLEDQLEEFQGLYKQFERQTAEAQAALEKDNSRLLEVKTNREYDAIRQEMFTNEESVNTNENEQLRVTEEIETIEQALAEEEADFRKTLQTLTEQIDTLQVQISDVDDTIAKTQSRRDSALKDLNPGVIQAYDRIRRGREVAVVKVERGACGGCFHTLPPQRINEVRRMDRMVPCEACGRLLVWEEVSQ